MKIKYIVFIGFIFMALFTIGCKKQENEPSVKETDNQFVSLYDIEISDQFNYPTSQMTQFKIAIMDNQGNGLPGIPIEVFHKQKTENGNKILTMVTNNLGLVDINYPLPSYQNSVFLYTDYIGIPGEIEVPVYNNQVTYIIGGLNEIRKSQATKMPQAKTLYNITLNYLGSYDEQGLPGYLEAENEIIDAAFLNDINASFPENMPVPQYHPEYLAFENETNIIINQPAEVWVTFVHEGAGYKNTLGFYTYDISNPPTSISDISEITIIFPNVSFSGSGGSLQSGNKVKIGTFQENTVIGWVLFANGFRNGQVTTGNHIVFSNTEINPESDPDKKQHNVFLIDPGRNKLLLGFEDLLRDQSGCDNDFNDALFFVSSNPIVAVETGRFPMISYTSDDTDDDGISDNLDLFPNDPSRAFINYYPAQNTYGTLVFEDLWPGRGDYDFNDLVIDYYYELYVNGQNEITSINIDYKLKAIGASYKNGFGIELPIPASSVSSIVGQRLSEGIISLNANNTESGHVNACIIIFDNAYNILPYPPGATGTGVNTNQNDPYVVPESVHIQIDFNNPVGFSEIGAPPFNPFIFINQERGREVHLPNKPPTELANYHYFGTENDNSDPALGRYYKTHNNLPWALNLIEPFHYPIEKSAINKPYLKFNQWALSAGHQYQKWFHDSSGYVNEQFLYSQY